MAATLALLILFLSAGWGLAAPLRVAVISDLNGGYGSIDYAPRVAAAVERIVELRPDLVLSTGDMVAGQRQSPKLTAAELDAMWAAFHATVTRPLAAAGVPLAITPGNHDASAYDGYARERERYAAAWSEPPAVKMVDAARYPFAYAFSVANALFVSLDATTVGPLPAAEMSWLEALLAREAPRHSAVVVFSHLPLWPFAVGRETEIIGDSQLAALFRRYGVDLHLSGHHHAYYPGVEDGVMLVAQACLGGGPRRLIGDAERAPQSFTMIEIAEDGAIEVYALAAPDYRTRIGHESLPPEIATQAATIRRIDLARE